MDKPKICAFAICATGERYIKFREHLVEQLQWYVPGVDIVDIDPKDAGQFLPYAPKDRMAYFARLAVPLMDRFQRYERIIYIDVDVVVQSGMFAGILDVDTNGVGVASLSASCGLIVYDLADINKELWKKKVSKIVKSAKKATGNAINIECASPSILDGRYLCSISYTQKERDAAWCIHYCGRHDDLDRIINSGEDIQKSPAFFTVSPQCGRVVAWIRSYFEFGDGNPLAIVSGKDWSNAEIDYCKATSEFCGGIFIDGQGREVSDADIRQTLDGLKITHWKHVESEVDIRNEQLLDKDAYPPAPFEPIIQDLAKQVKVVDATPYRVPDDQAIDAVFVIGKGSRNNNEELRYALRNIAKHCPFVRDVYISGECPEWVDKSVVKHLQWPDKFRHAKDANIIDKLRHACEQKGIAKRILFCSDDQFQTHVCTWEDFFPRYLRQYESNDKWYEEMKRVWHTRLRNTLERDKKRRQAAGLDTSHIFYYEPHMWMQIDRDKFIEYAKWSDYEHSADTIIASGYFNFVDANGHPHDKKYDHVFIGAGTKTLPKATHIAYTDEGYDQAMTFLKALFPDKCKYEIDGNASAIKSVEPVQRNVVMQAQSTTPLQILATNQARALSPARTIDRVAIKNALHRRIFGKIVA